MSWHQAVRMSRCDHSIRDRDVDVGTMLGGLCCLWCAWDLRKEPAVLGACLPCDLASMEIQWGVLHGCGKHNQLGGNLKCSTDHILWVAAWFASAAERRSLATIYMRLQLKASLSTTCAWQHDVNRILMHHGRL
jgi:hypothetical protein